MNDQVAVQKLLRRKLNELQARNPSFSVRAFAARLKLQPSATNEILKGERRVSRKLAERLAISLHLDPSERAEFLKHFPLKRSKTAVTDRGSNIGSELSERDVLKLTSDQFSVISDWIHFAILNLTKLENAPQDYAAISERLGITETKATSAVDRLLRLGLLEKNSSGEWKRTFSRVNT
ncbi:MAG: TIGR02147 family protein, partial [Proteobacteria bacterium]